MKKGDYLVILIILLISSSMFYINKGKMVENNNKYILVKVNGKEYSRYEINNKNKNKRFKIKTKYGENEIEILEDGVVMRESSCKDKICIHMGTIKNVKESIICLPNRLIITIENKERDKEKNSQVDVVVQ